MSAMSSATSATSVHGCFEACSSFHASPDDLFVCTCGWLEDDHRDDPRQPGAVRVIRRRRRTKVPRHRGS